MFYPPIGVIPDGTVTIAMSVSELLGPVTAIAMAATAVAGLAIVIGLVVDLRVRAGLRRLTLAAPDGKVEVSRPSAA
jgi:hypothetical protein